MTESAEQRCPADDLGPMILEAARAELLSAKAGAFSHERVAARAGVPLQEIRQRWPATVDLLSAALGAYLQDRLPVPDTGSLRGDLLSYAGSIRDIVNTQTGRRLVDAVIGRPSEWDLHGARAGALHEHSEHFAVIVRRAVDRGDCPSDTDPRRLIDLIGVGVATPSLFYGRDVEEADVIFVVDTVLGGVAVGRTSRD